MNLNTMTIVQENENYLGFLIHIWLIRKHANIMLYWRHYIQENAENVGVCLLGLLIASIGEVPVLEFWEVLSHTFIGITSKYYKPQKFTLNCPTG